MKLAFGILIAILGVGWGLAPLLRTRREQLDSVSEAWRREQERRDLIRSVQWDGHVRWPWNADDEAA